MEKRKWLWKKKSSERSSGESESSGSFSSQFERSSDEQEVLRDRPSNDNAHSPDVTSKAAPMDGEEMDGVKSLTRKLSAALVNVSAKEELVKQHAKVAEEAVAGWEKAEDEVLLLKQQLEAALQQNAKLDARASHLDGALKECVRQLRQSRDEQEERISNAVHDKTIEWDSKKAELEQQILDLQTNYSTSLHPETLIILESLERENTSLRRELGSRLEELEIVAIERDLSTRAAESASRAHLESIKKIARLEADCRKLQSAATRRSAPASNNKPLYAESLTDSCKSSSSTSEHNNCFDFDALKNEKHSTKNLPDEIDMMDDFLEMERRLLYEESISADNPSRAELDLMRERMNELENEVKRLETEKLQLRNALNESLDRTKEVEMQLEKMEEELQAANEAKEMLEFQLVGMEAEARTHSATVESLKAEIEGGKKLSAELSAKCRELESEVAMRIQETELLEESIKLEVGAKVKQEDIAIATDKLAECQKTIASLGRQLKSLATLEDFLIDTSTIPGFSRNPADCI